MQRLVVEERRSIRLEWLARQNAFDVRLVRGETLMTPACHLTPLHWYDLLNGTVVGLKDWFHLLRVGKELVEIRPLIDLRGLGMLEPYAWPPVKWYELHDAATRERGCRPETGWHKVAEELAEAARDSWR